MFNANDLIIIENKPLTTPYKIYTILYIQERTRTQHDPPNSGDYVEWVAYINDMGVTDFVRATQCKLYVSSLKLEYEDYLIEKNEEGSSKMLEFLIPQINNHYTFLHNLSISPEETYSAILKITKVKVTIEEIK